MTDCQVSELRGRLEEVIRVQERMDRKVTMLTVLVALMASERVLAVLACMM